LRIVAHVLASLAVTFICFFPVAHPVTAYELPRTTTLTCDWHAIDPESYALTTTSEAVNLLSPRYDFWNTFEINSHIRDLRDLNLGARDLAERARDRDPGNLMAHSILARQYLILNWARPAEDAWRTVLNNGGAVIWTATLYDVDSKSYFLMAFDRHAVRIYRMGQFTRQITRHLGMAEFPNPGETRFYEAVAGCPDSTVSPVATVPWQDVKEIKAGNWVLWFKLTRPVTIVSDGNEKQSLREIKVNLHGETGRLTFLASPNPGDNSKRSTKKNHEPSTVVRGLALGPYDYQHRVRDMLVRFVDPAGRIKLSSSARGAGW
jgi:hypothetical protein